MIAGEVRKWGKLVKVKFGDPRAGESGGDGDVWNASPVLGV